MTPLLQLAGFALGVYLSIRMIAALYLVLDLWYAIGMYYPRVLTRVAGWASAIAVTGWLLPAHARAAFGLGLLGFLAFYLGLFVLRYPLLWLLARQREAER